MNNYANLLSDQGRLDEAEPLYKEALEGFREMLGARHKDTLNSMNNDANLLKQQGLRRGAQLGGAARGALLNCLLYYDDELTRGGGGSN